MQEIKLTLTIAEVNFLLRVIGELPTKTGAFSLLQKIENQAASQQENTPAE